MPKHNRPLDELDRSILRLLKNDGRRTYADMSKALGVPEATIRQRFNRLVREGHTLVVALTRRDTTGPRIDVMVGLNIVPSKMLEVARAVARLEGVRWLAITSGAYDILFSATFGTDQELLTFLTENVGKIEGIDSIRTHHVLQHVKRTIEWWDIEDV